MSIAVTFYSFSKRVNSTKQPEGGTTFQCLLKEGCGVVSPTIVVSTTNPSSYNYAYIPSFERYYFITEWTSYENLWTAYMRVDALASWKTYIGAETFYKLRAENDFSGSAIDSMLVAGTAYTESHGTVSLTWNSNASTRSGMYVLGVTGGDSSGAIVYYALAPDQFASFMSYIFTDVTILTGIDENELSDSMQKAFIDPMKFVTMCKWFPIPLLATDGSNIKLGYWELKSVTGGKLSAGAAFSTQFSIPLAQHPDIDTYGSTLYYPPFTRRKIFIPPFGDIEIDPTLTAGQTSLQFTTRVDLISGAAWLIANYDEGDQLVSTCSFGVDMGMSSTSINIAQLSDTSAIGGGLLLSVFAGGAATSNAAWWDVGTRLADASRSVLGAVTTGNTRSASGGTAIYSRPATYTSVFHEVFAPSPSEAGKMSLSNNTLTAGFNIVLHGEISCPATASELTDIKSYLEGGMYYE